MRKPQTYACEYLVNEIRAIENSPRIDKNTALSIYEKAIIYKYSEDGYEGLNDILRTSNGKTVTEFGKLLADALSKLPNYEGLVYRKVSLTKTELNVYEEGLKNNSTIVETPFLSTSKARAVAMAFTGNCLFRILSKKGKDIETIAKYGVFNPPNEKEVLFKNNTKFKVLQITREDEHSLITMEEV